MKQEQRMKCCYFPTTTVSVDDNPDFLSMASLKIEGFSPCKAFSNPAKALEYINNEYSIRPFYDQFFINVDSDRPRNRCTLSVDFTNIHKQMYNPNRFLEITGLLVDYAMPRINGRQFCEAMLKGCGWRNWSNIILLTGEANLETTVSMVKDQLINGYISKRDKGYLDKLVEMIRSKQNDYFERGSNLFINMIADSAEIMGFRPSCLKDSVFVDFFYKMVELHQPAEYYLIDELGSYVFLSESGKLSWLIVQSEDDMEANAFEMTSDHTVPPEILNAVNERKALVYNFSQDEYYPKIYEPSDWKKYVYPATIINGNKATYYYSYIETPLVETFIDLAKIFSYDDYRNGLNREAE